MHHALKPLIALVFVAGCVPLAADGVMEFYNQSGTDWFVRIPPGAGSDCPVKLSLNYNSGTLSTMPAGAVKDATLSTGGGWYMLPAGKTGTLTFVYSLSFQTALEFRGMGSKSATFNVALGKAELFNQKRRNNTLMTLVAEDKARYPNYDQILHVNQDANGLLEIKGDQLP